MTEPLAVDRDTKDLPAGPNRRPAKPTGKHLALAEPIRLSPAVVDPSQHLPIASAPNGDQSPSSVAVLLTRDERANRALNILLAASALIVLSPLLILIALAVKLTSRGPVLYTQVRVGRDHRFDSDRRLRRERRYGADRRAGLDRRGRIERRAFRNRRARMALATYGRRCEDIGGNPIRIYKFRSMCVGAECGSGPVWATRNDARVTAVGGVLRRYRLDELPQLINVLKGEMNIVGPRPERPKIFSQLRMEIPEYSLRQRARPGITGWAQIKQRYDSCIEDVRGKVRFDLEYLARRSLREDIRIMVKTIPVMVFRRGSL